MRDRDVLRRLAWWALAACAACLVVENSVLLAWAVATRPTALFAAASAVFRTACALAVPTGLVAATAVAGWLLPTGSRVGDRRGGAR